MTLYFKLIGIVFPETFDKNGVSNVPGDYIFPYLGRWECLKPLKSFPTAELTPVTFAKRFQRS